MTTIPQSFFDDENTFSFNNFELKHMALLKTPSKLEANILCQSIELDFKLRGLFKLHDHSIVYYKEGFSNSPVYVLDILHTKLSKVVKSANNTRYKIRLSKNQTSFDFYFLRKEEAENWRNELKSVCVLDGFHEEYDPIDILGTGAFASVHLVKHNSTSILFAVKGFHKQNFIKPNSQATLISEINMMRKNDHKNLINLYEVYESENSIYLVMEYTTGRTLRHLLNSRYLSDPQVMEITKSILSVLSYFESQKIMHRDLKPDNILIDNDLNVKIIDFGLAAYYDMKDFLHDRCGTAGYVAPEIFKFDRNNPESFYDNKCDVFSAGCILFQMLLGFRMFEGDNAGHTLKLNGMYCHPQSSKHLKRYLLTEIKNPDSQVSKQGLYLLLKMLEPDHELRISASEALNHPYFDKRSISFNDVISDSALDEKLQHHSSVAMNLPKTVTKCLLSINCSVISTDKKVESPLKSTRISQFSSQDETLLSPSTCGTSIGREFSFEKTSSKQTGKSQRMSTFSPLKRNGQKSFDFDENSEEIHEDGDEEQCMVEESLKTYRRIVNVNKPCEMMKVVKKKEVCL